jgi:hypothetical protein
MEEVEVNLRTVFVLNTLAYIGMVKLMLKCSRTRCGWHKSSMEAGDHF